MPFSFPVTSIIAIVIVLLSVSVLSAALSIPVLFPLVIPVSLLIFVLLVLPLVLPSAVTLLTPVPPLLLASFLFRQFTFRWRSQPSFIAACLLNTLPALMGGKPCESLCMNLA